MKDALSGLALGLLSGEDKALFHSSAPMTSDSWGWAGLDAVTWSWGTAALGLVVNWVKAQLLAGLTGEVGWERLCRPHHLSGDSTSNTSCWCPALGCGSMM